MITSQNGVPSGLRLSPPVWNSRKQSLTFMPDGSGSEYPPGFTNNRVPSKQRLEIQLLRVLGSIASAQRSDETNEFTSEFHPAIDNRCKDHLGQKRIASQKNVPARTENSCSAL
jgi:hypothetical protein